ACVFARANRDGDALRELGALLPAVERAGGPAHHSVLCWAAEALWSLERADFADPLERNLRAKVIAPDFRCVSVDARRALAKLCALTGRFDEARQWFGRARKVLDEQGARPLRALVDLDEAEMELRRGAAGDRGRGGELLEAAVAQFETIGMPGWGRHAAGVWAGGRGA